MSEIRVSVLSNGFREDLVVEKALGQKLNWKEYSKTPPGEEYLLLGITQTILSAEVSSEDREIAEFAIDEYHKNLEIECG